MIWEGTKSQCYVCMQLLSELQLRSSKMLCFCIVVCDCMDAFNAGIMRSLEIIRIYQLSPHHVHWSKILPELCPLLRLIQPRRECTVHLPDPLRAQQCQRWEQELNSRLITRDIICLTALCPLCYSEEFRLEVIVVRYEISAAYILLLSS